MRVPNLRRMAESGITGKMPRPRKFLPRWKVSISEDLQSSDGVVTRRELGTAFAHRRFRQSGIRKEDTAVTEFQQWIEFILPRNAWLEVEAEKFSGEIGGAPIGGAPIGADSPQVLKLSGVDARVGLYVEDEVDRNRYKIIGFEVLPDARILLRTKARTA